MKLLGASSVLAEEVIGEVRAAAFEGRAALFWTDGEDCLALVADGSEGPELVIKQARRMVPEFA